MLSGWVDGEVGDSPEVSVFLNRVRAAKVPLIPHPDHAGRHVFRFKARPLLRYARRTDRLTVRYAGDALPFADTGDVVHRPVEHGPLPTSELRRRLAAGDIFNSDGHLQRPKNADVNWQSGVLALYDTVRTALRDAEAPDAFLIYGSLLGAIRDGGFIGHDTDLDAGYVSAHTHGPDAARELTEIARELIRRGLHVECRVVCLHIYDPVDTSVHIDLFHTFFDAEGTLLFPWGVASHSTYRREQWHGTQETDFAGARVLIPSEPEAMIEAIYGADWRTPNPSFSWHHDRTTYDLTGRVQPKPNSAVNWTDFYTRQAPQSATSFVQTCLQRSDLPSTVIDLGCGDGRDSITFAEHGCRVTGVDAAPTAIEAARGRSGAADIEFAVLDLDDLEELRRVVNAARESGGALLFYGYRLLDSVFDDTAAALLEFIAEVARPGDAVAFASATTAPAKSPLRPRRPVDAAALQRAFADAAFATLHTATVEAHGGPVHELIARR